MVLDIYYPASGNARADALYVIRSPPVLKL
jgi:hypothetical protein